MIYLDNNATTRIAPEVFEAMKPYFIEQFGNPSSLHQQGLQARDAIAKARTQTAALINAESLEEIIFTSSGTEAANLALNSQLPLRCACGDTDTDIGTGARNCIADIS